MNSSFVSNLIAASFDNRYLLTLAIVVTFVAGYSAVTGLPRLEDPVITNRGAQIITVFPGASADRVEALVSEKIEEELDEISQIKKIDSTSRAGVSFVSYELEDAVQQKDVEAISSEVRDAMADAAREFPAEVLPPSFDDKRGAVAYTILLALKWADSLKDADQLSILSRRAKDLSDALRSVSGTELVRIYGQPREEITVEVLPEKLTQLSLTPRDVAEAIRKADVKVPAGVLRAQEANLFVEVDGRIDSLERIRNAIILQDGNEARTIRVGDVAAVRRAWQDPPRQKAFTEGQRAIFVAARVEDDVRVDLWDQTAKQVVADFRETTGSALSTEILYQQNVYTEARLKDLVANLILGALVVVIVIFLTMGWRRSLIVSLALPLTAAGTLFVLSLQGGKLHQMSIFGMIIALGLLIDTAIVITDETRKYLAKGLTRRDAVISTVKHLFVPLLSSTLTSILAFLPILLLPGNAGDFVGSIGNSVILAIMLSFLFSLTIISALAGIFSNKPASGDKQGWFVWIREGLQVPWFGKLMGGIIGASVRFPPLGILLGISVPILGFLAASTLGSQFFPRTDRNMFTVQFNLPSAASLHQTATTAQEMEELIREESGVRAVHWVVGASFPPVYYNLIENRDNSPEYAMAVIETENFRVTDRLVPSLQDRLERAFPETLLRVSKFAQGPPAIADVELRISGPNIATLQTLGNEVHRILGEHPDILHAESTMKQGEPKLWFQADEAKTRSAGLELASVADQLQTNLEGLEGGSLVEAVEELPVRVRLPKERRHTISGIADLRVVSAEGNKVPLRALGDFELRPEAGAITRYNGQRVNKILGYAAIGSLPIEITQEVVQKLDESGFQLPTGYKLAVGGESENQADAVGNLLLFLPVIITVTIAILILSFRSVRVAFILLATAPLAAGYGLLATWVMDLPVSFNTILGCIGLVGLAFNDNIVTLAAIYSNPDAKRGDAKAIRDQILGCGRHLISTTLTTIGSFLPLLILIGGQFWPPLAIVLAGGVGGATFLAAVFTPAAYRLFVSRKYRHEGPTAAMEKTKG
ncbi:MAG: efflux RND transporter permease subunit [Verrucomicrobiota bacterium]